MPPLAHIVSPSIIQLTQRLIDLFLVLNKSKEPAVQITVSESGE